MDENQRTAIIKETFNTVAESYDIEPLRFFTAASRHFASFLDLKGDEHVLDVATGTGNAAFDIARLLERGRVTGVDFSEGMLEQARRKAALMNINNTDFIEGNMQNLDFPDNHFDVSVCAFGIFFVDDMLSQLKEISRVVRPGGKVAITCFTEDYFSPQIEILIAMLKDYGVQIPPQIWKQISHEYGCIELFRNAGFDNIRVEHRNVGYNLESSLDWWDIIWNAGYRRMISQIDQEKQKQFKIEHLAEIEKMSKPEGIWLDVGVLYTVGIKP